jgi:hypothetical protein
MKKLLLPILMLVAISGSAASPSVSKEKASPVAAENFKFMPFPASNKNMWQHGILLEVATGRAWLIESRSNGEGHPDQVVALPVEFHPKPTDDASIARVAVFSPKDADDLYTFMVNLQQQMARDKK